MSPVSPARAPMEERADTSPLSSERALRAASAAAYEWTIATDALRWSAHAAELLGTTPEAIATGAGWAALAHPEALATRGSVILGTTRQGDHAGVAYEVEHALTSHVAGESRALWVEDVGRWHPGADGRPALASGIVRVVTERHQAEQRLARDLRMDPPTGTLNRLRLFEVLDTTIGDAKRYQTSCALALVAVEHVTALTEAYGPDVTDEIFATVARRLRETMRNRDAIGRLSRSTFGLVLTQCSRGDLAVAAQRFLDAVHREPIQTAAGPVSVQVSAAGIVGPRHARTRKDMALLAGDALAQVRRTRRGTFAAYAPDPKRAESRKRDLALIQDLAAGLTEERVALAFQPIVAAATGEVAWQEALARIVSPTAPPISVSQHVQAAEKLGLIHLLDRRVLELTIGLLGSADARPVAINISAETTTDTDWLNRLTDFLDAGTGLAEKLIVEITETAELSDIGQAGRFVAALRGRGVRIALDDFGAGHSSFRSLHALTVDIVKIDGGLIENLDGSASARSVVRAIVSLSRDMGFKTVAEHVEAPATAEILRSLGLDYLQGDLFGAAVLPAA